MATTKYSFKLLRTYLPNAMCDHIEALGQPLKREILILFLDLAFKNSIKPVASIDWLYELSKTMDKDLAEIFDDLILQFEFRMELEKRPPDSPNDTS